MDRFLRISLFALCACQSMIFAENIIYPHVKFGTTTDVSGIVDVSLPPYSIDRTGSTDVTAVLQKAFDDHPTWGTVYLPNGTYLVSNTIQVGPPCYTSPTSSNCGNTRPILQGQSRAATVIKLAAGMFTNAGSPKPILFVGDGVAQVFNRGVHNIRILVGANNAGANGVRWYSNNMGLMSDVDIISSDASANIGVDLAGGEQGPCGMRDVYVKGFAIGCKSDALNSVTVWNLTVENGRQYGVLNSHNPLYIENLTTINCLVGVRNQGALTLVTANMTGGTTAKSAIENTSQLFARDIRATGYANALTTSGRAAPSGLSFTEYSSSQVSQFPSPTRSMNLPARQIPDVPWEQDSTKWGNTWANKFNGAFQPMKTDSASLQGLIDNPNLTTVCIPFGRILSIDCDIYVRGNISRITGTGSQIGGSGRLIITNDLAVPVVKIERLICGLPIINQSNKTVIIESCVAEITGEGSGDMFISDIVGAPITFNSPTQHVWAWQFNAEGGGSVPGPGHVKTVVQNVGTLRIVGWKDEPQYQSLELTRGIVEILGYMYYASSSTSGQTMFVVRDGAQFCVAGASQISFNGTEFSNLVQETRGSVTRMLTSSANGGGWMALYCGYDSAVVAQAITPVALPSLKPAAVTPVSARVIGRSIAIAGALDAKGNALPIALYSVNGHRVANCTPRMTGQGSYALDGLASGAYVAVVGRNRSIAHRVMVP